MLNFLTGKMIILYSNFFIVKSCQKKNSMIIGKFTNSLLKHQKSHLIRNFASKMQASSTNNTKDSKGKHLGVKKLGDQYVYPGDIIVRQRGFKWHPKHNVAVGRDHTITATVEGIVHYEKRPDYFKRRTEVSVIPMALPSRNKDGSTPPYPICFHPEQFPNLAKNNPEPFFAKYKMSTNKEKRAKIKAAKEGAKKFFGKVVENEENRRDVVKIPDSWFEREMYDASKLPSFGEQLSARGWELEDTYHGEEGFEANTVNVEAN